MGRLDLDLCYFLQDLQSLKMYLNCSWIPWNFDLYAIEAVERYILSLYVIYYFYKEKSLNLILRLLLGSFEDLRRKRKTIRTETLSIRRGRMKINMQSFHTYHCISCRLLLVSVLWDAFER